MSMWSLVTANGEIAGDFRLDAQGRFVDDNTAATAMYLALTTESWWAEPNGSRIAELVRNPPAANAEAAIVDAARAALAPLEERGRIQDIAVAVQLTDHRAQIAASAFDVAARIPVQVKVTPL
ncbi:MAG: hypothetical protein MJE77_11025 [Proteobacteria bacterium]|nr:hypothetical protein [Pseudomonadota bacterium]